LACSSSWLLIEQRPLPARSGLLHFCCRRLAAVRNPIAESGYTLNY